MSRKKPLIGITTDIKDGHFMIEEQYARSVSRAGGIPLLIPSISGDGNLIRHSAARIDGLMLPGSRDMDPGYYGEEPHPKLRPMSLERTETELKVLREAVERGIPVLGICGGMQLINVFFGGSLYQDIRSYVPEAAEHEKGAIHDIAVKDETLLREIAGTGSFSARSYHHQSVREVGKGLIVSASAPDGIVEAVESSEPPLVLGIQWHPELEDMEISARIFKYFTDRCGG